jgi:hypothetical protein
MSPCPHERTTPVDGGHECVSCGTVLDRPRLASLDGGEFVPPPHRQLEHLAEVRKALRPEGGGR